MEDKEILKQISDEKNNFGTCAKFAGAVTVEIIKEALEKHGISTSPRDVFIKGIPIEIDLLIPKRGVLPKHGILYEPQDVLVVLEIKNRGSFGKETINNIKGNYHRIKQINKKITCVYVTLSERKGFPDRVTRKNTGFYSYTLFWHSGSGKNFKNDPTDDWQKLLEKLNEIIQRG
ncbi:MAG: hypothetical protein MUP17_03115 [candidate division Zixibacteria bacterium]|nr:hypothetical protein [candidate division Zixibacteria bacterium]